MIWSIKENRRSLAGLEALKDASREDLRVLLCLMEAGSIEEGDLAVAAQCSPGEVTASLGFWRGAGIVRQGGETETVKAASTEIGRVTRTRRLAYTGDELGNKIKHYGLGSLISACEGQMGKEFGRMEIDVLVYCTEQLELDGDFLLLLLADCCKREKRSMKYVEKVAISLLERGIDTAAKLEKHLETENLRRSVLYRIRALFGIVDRAPTAKEEKLLDKWTLDFGYGEDMVRHAYDKTVNNTGKAAVSYADKLLSNWHQNGCKTPEEADACDERERLAKGLPKKSAKKEAAKQTFSFDPEEAMASALSRSYSDKKD